MGALHPKLRVCRRVKHRKIENTWRRIEEGALYGTRANIQSGARQLNKTEFRRRRTAKTQRARRYSVAGETPLRRRRRLRRIAEGLEMRARLLFVKGKSWEYEKEVRLLVDQQRTRLLDNEDKVGWPMRVLDIPTEVIEEVHVRFNTPEKEVGRMAQLVGGKRRGWKLNYTSSHAYRMQMTTTINH